MVDKPGCAFCGSTEHTYKHHYPAPTEALYEKLKERWADFLGEKIYCIYTKEDMDMEEADDWYGDLVDEFCGKYGYSEGLKEMAFYDYWWDTFKDMFFKKLRGGTLW